LILSSGKRNDLRALLKTILDQIRSWYRDLANPSAIMEEWWRNCVHRPLRVRIAMPSGSITGISRGIDEEGDLMIETEDHRIWKVSEGSLTLLDD
jgi:biotin-(acetyl-CoA carboxylase) ligase